MINIIKSTIHFKSLTLMIKRKTNQLFSRNNEGPKDHTLVTIRGGVRGERRGEEDQDEQGLGDEGVKVQ